MGIREILFTFKLHGAELLSFRRYFFHRKFKTSILASVTAFIPLAVATILGYNKKLKFIYFLRDIFHSGL